MIGAPVSRWARATARAMVSRGGVTPSKSAAHLSMPALTPVPRKPSSMSRMNSRAIWLGPTPVRKRGTSSHQPVTLMMLTPEPFEAATSSSALRPRSKVVASRRVSIPAALASDRAAMARASLSWPRRSG